MSKAEYSRHRFDGRYYRLGALAGLAGGIAEIAWILLYASLSAADAAAVARGVTYTFSPQLASVSTGIALGIAIHMMIALMLGVAVAVAAKLVLPRSRSALLEPCFVVATLIAVWVVNFHALLPLLNPSFVQLVPLGASLASKVTFGIATALVLQSAYWGSLPLVSRGRDWEGV